MKKTNPAFASPCGLYCGVCAIHIAHRDNNEKFKERLVNLYKGGVPGKGTLPNSEDLTTADIRYGGCLPGLRRDDKIGKFRLFTASSNVEAVAPLRQIFLLWF